MADPGLSALFQLPPERARDYLESKGYRITQHWAELTREAHAQAFTVAGIARLDLLQDIRGALETALKEGKTERWFRQTVQGALARKGWGGALGGRRLQTIYRTNLQSAYMAGRQRQFDEEQAEAPFVQYLAVRDSRTRPHHAALHGQVFRLDDPAWDIVCPTNGYNCRCRARNFSQRELDARGLKVQNDTRIETRTLPKAPPGLETQRGVSVPDPDHPGQRKTLWPDLGWDYNPGRAGLAQLDAVLKRKEAALGVAERMTVAARAAQFRAAALANRSAKQPPLPLGAVPETASAAIVALGAASRERTVALDHDYILHIDNNHGQSQEAKRGQVPIDADDLAAVAALLAGATDIRPGDPPRAKNGALLFEAVVQTDGFIYRIVFEARKRMIVPYTMFKRRRK